MLVRRALLVLFALILSLGVALPGTAADVGRTRVVGDCLRATYEPSRVVIACGDYNEYATIRHYDSWTRHQARGSGRLVVNDCRPDCASGTFHAFPATFSLHRVVTNDRGTQVFSRLGITYVKGGRQHDTTVDLVTDPIG